uniref:SHSP domain-containing protein n=1 Tax=Haemonchus contortus TaxID=6289 RepID=A0A7I5E9Y9_HAECO
IPDRQLVRVQRVWSAHSVVFFTLAFLKVWEGMVSGKIIEDCVCSIGNRIFSCWNDEEASSNVIEEEKNVINNATKFSISMDVSLFKPDELRVHINGREVIVEGNQEKCSDVGYIQRSFVKRWTIPDDADLDALEANLSGSGSLLIETPKTGLHTLKREVPIRSASREPTAEHPNRVVVIN